MAVEEEGEAGEDGGRGEEREEPRAGEGGVAVEEDVPDEAVIAAVDHCVTGNVGAVRQVVGRGAVHYGFESHRAADEVVDECAALAEQLEGRG